MAEETGAVPSEAMGYMGAGAGGAGAAGGANYGVSAQQNIRQQQLAQQQYMQQLNQQLTEFWGQQREACDNVTDVKNHLLPLARIKKIMKSDEDVRMISAEAPVLFAKACEMFIVELTLRAWAQTEEAKRRTLQRSDISLAIQKTDIFDFLIDIVPREDPIKKEDPNLRPPESSGVAPAATQASVSAGAPQAGMMPGVPYYGTPGIPYGMPSQPVPGGGDAQTGVMYNPQTGQPMYYGAPGMYQPAPQAVPGAAPGAQPQQQQQMQQAYMRPQQQHPQAPQQYMYGSAPGVFMPTDPNAPQSAPQHAPPQQ
mmetsp:Transcript_15990/g.34583  ORF Transcript_15990/g.34583 Transcript_15990/m.34583 type:complete len:311 (+) Transcript_15990:61-993(+)